MSIRDEPHYRIASTELAAWLEQQGTDSLWEIDGDHLLFRYGVRLPCYGSELAAALRRVNRFLLVLDCRPGALGRGEEITAKELDAVVVRWGDGVRHRGPLAFSPDDREFWLCWAEMGEEWELREDRNATVEEAMEAGLVPRP